MKSRDADGEIEPDLAAYRNRLQRDGPVGAANQNIGAESRPDACFAGRADIVTSEETRAGDGLSEYRPDHHAAAGHAEIKPELGDRAVIVLPPPRPVRLIRRDSTRNCSPVTAYERDS